MQSGWLETDGLAKRSTSKSLLLSFVLGSLGTGTALAGQSFKGLTLLEAAKATLLSNPALQSQAAQVEINRGRMEIAAGAFDTAIQSGLFSTRNGTPQSAEQQLANSLLGAQGAEDITDLTNLTVGISRLFRNGISVAPGILLTRTTDNISDLTGTNTAIASLVATVPLLRGRGRASADAQELAAVRELTASQLDVGQLAAQLILTTATDYWSLLAAQKNYLIASDAELRGTSYLQRVTDLVGADHVARNDLNDVRANLAQRTATRIAAGQQIVAAQSQLGLDIGQSPTELARASENPSDSYPLPEAAEISGELSPNGALSYLAAARMNRSDYRASRIREKEQSILVVAANNGLLPQLNLSLSTGYSGLQEGRTGAEFLQAAGIGVRSPNAGLGLNFSFPFRNQSARGTLLQAQQVLRQAELQTLQIERQISSSITVSVSNVVSSRARVAQTSNAVSAYQAALQGERDKYAGGIGSIIAIFTVEDRLTAAMMDSVAAQQLYATALAQFRFATGTLVSADKPLDLLTTSTFTSIPDLRLTQGGAER